MNGVTYLGADDLGNVARLRERCRRIATSSTIRADYASYYEPRPADACWLAGAKSLRFVPAGEPDLFKASDLSAALADLLVIVDLFIVHGRKVSLGGVPFPHLAFNEFVELLLFWPVVVGVDPEAVGAIDVVDRYAFNPGEAYVDVLLALLARDWARFVVELEHKFTDPVWAMFQRTCWPGHADLFLANVRRCASLVTP